MTVVITCLAQPPKDPDLSKFVPETATLLKDFKINFDNQGELEIVLAYAFGNSPDITTGVRVLKYSATSGWRVAYEETDGVINGAGASDAIRIEKVRASNRREGVVVTLQYSGAGTAAAWHVLASVNDRIRKIDPGPQTAKALRARDYEHQGYNAVKSDGNLIIETLAGYSRRQARCCPNRPSLAMSFKFTGNTIALDSVTELPYGRPKSGLYGPLLRVSGRGLWAYGYEMLDGFLVLASSEILKNHVPSTPPAIVALRKRLMDDGILVDVGDYLTMMADYKFKSSAEAAGVILARRANGLEWKDQNGRPADTRKTSSKAH